MARGIIPLHSKRLNPEVIGALKCQPTEGLCAGKERGTAPQSSGCGGVISSPPATRPHVPNRSRAHHRPSSHYGALAVDMGDPIVARVCGLWLGQWSAQEYRPGQRHGRTIRDSAHGHFQQALPSYGGYHLASIARLSTKVLDERPSPVSSILQI
jgi:hypothetical protein